VITVSNRESSDFLPLRVIHLEPVAEARIAEKVSRCTRVWLYLLPELHQVRVDLLHRVGMKQ
jgi:hypothetical protein